VVEVAGAQFDEILDLGQRPVDRVIVCSVGCAERRECVGHHHAHGLVDALVQVQPRRGERSESSLNRVATLSRMEISNMGRLVIWGDKK
jgi:hypothetical protein